MPSANNAPLSLSFSHVPLVLSLRRHCHFLLSAARIVRGLRLRKGSGRGVLEQSMAGQAMLLTSKQVHPQLSFVLYHITADGEKKISKIYMSRPFLPSKLISFNRKWRPRTSLACLDAQAVSFQGQRLPSCEESKDPCSPKPLFEKPREHCGVESQGNVDFN